MRPHPRINMTNQYCNKNRLAMKLGVAESTISSWIARYPDFPAPEHINASGQQLFSLQKVEKWADNHYSKRNTRRPKRR